MPSFSPLAFQSGSFFSGMRCHQHKAAASPRDIIQEQVAAEIERQSVLASICTPPSPTTLAPHHLLYLIRVLRGCDCCCRTWDGRVGNISLAHFLLGARYKLSKYRFQIHFKLACIARRRVKRSSRPWRRAQKWTLATPTSLFSSLAKAIFFSFYKFHHPVTFANLSAITFALYWCYCRSYSINCGYKQWPAQLNRRASNPYSAAFVALTLKFSSTLEWRSWPIAALFKNNER